MNDTDVQLISGHASDDELAAISVAVSALSVLSREEAYERELAERAGAPHSEWNSAMRRFPSATQLRTQPSPTAWTFSQR